MPLPGSTESGWRNESRRCLWQCARSPPGGLEPPCMPYLRSFEVEMKMIFRRLQFSGMCGRGFAPRMDVLFQPWILVYFSIQTFDFVWINHQLLTSLPLSVYLFRHRTPRTDYQLSTQSLYGNYRIAKRRSICRWVYLLWNRTSLTNLCHPI